MSAYVVVTVSIEDPARTRSTDVWHRYGLVAGVGQ